MPNPALTVDENAEAVLVAHQRISFQSCLCGWSELGRSHPRHQVAMLREAELLKHQPLVQWSSRLMDPTDVQYRASLPDGGLVVGCPCGKPHPVQMYRSRPKPCQDGQQGVS